MLFRRNDLKYDQFYKFKGLINSALLVNQHNNYLITPCIYKSNTSHGVKAEYFHFQSKSLFFPDSGHDLTSKDHSFNFKILIPEERDVGIRLDTLLKKKIGCSWYEIQKFLKKKEIFTIDETDYRNEIYLQKILNDKAHRKACQGKERIKVNHRIFYNKHLNEESNTFRKSTSEDFKEYQEKINLRQWIIYKDSDFLILNKPYNISTHESREKDKRCVSEFLAQIKFSMDEMPRLLHRLPKCVAGLLVIARTGTIASMCNSLIEKGYFWVWRFWIIVPGALNKEEGLIRGSFSKSKDYFIPNPVFSGGKMYSVHWKLLKFSRNYEGFSLVEFRSNSPNSHALRALATYGLHSPIFGDDLYQRIYQEWSKATIFRKNSSHKSPDALILENTLKKNKIQMILMHARNIKIKTFGGNELSISAPPSSEFRNIMTLLGWGGFIKEEEEIASQENLWSVDTDPHFISSKKTLEDHLGEIGDNDTTGDMCVESLDYSDETSDMNFNGNAKVTQESNWVSKHYKEKAYKRTLK